MDDPDELYSLDECTTIDKKMTKKATKLFGNLMEQQMDNLQLVVLDAKSGLLKTWIRLDQDKEKDEAGKLLVHSCTGSLTKPFHAVMALENDSLSLDGISGASTYRRAIKRVDDDVMHQVIQNGYRRSVADRKWRELTDTGNPSTSPFILAVGYNSLANGGMGNQYVRDIRLVGDTAVMIMANILMPGNNPGDNISGNILYYLDTLLIDWTYMPWNDSINERKATVFIELGLDGAFMEDHFLYIGALDSAGNPFVVSSGKVELDPLNSHFFDVDNDGNIYITRYNEGSFHIPGLCTDSTGRFPVPFTVTNGGVSKLRVIADGRGDMFFTPPHKAAEWNLNVMKFSPHFERLINSVYVFDSTDVYSESNIFWELYTC